MYTFPVLGSEKLTTAKAFWMQQITSLCPKDMPVSRLILDNIDDLQSDQTLIAYADTLFPCVYDDFVSTAKSVFDSGTQKRIAASAGIQIQKALPA